MIKVRDYLNKKIDQGTVHLTLIDPVKQIPEAAARLARTAQELGSDLILVSGSSGLTQRALTDCVQAIKEKISIPVLFLPGCGQSLAFNFDAYFFLSLFNSRNGKFITGSLHSKISLILKRMAMEIIPIGYIVVEPGVKLSEIGEIDLVPRDNIWSAIGYALTAEFFGMSFIYLEAGSGAAQPVPASMIRAVKKEISLPLIVGGGIRTAIDARRVRQAGADIVVTGTIIENAGYRERLRSILSALKE